MDWTPFIAPTVTAVIAASGMYAAMSSRLARIEQKVDDLADDVRRHNGVVERTAILERDQKAAWREIEKVRNDSNAIRDEMHRLHSSCPKQ